MADEREVTFNVLATVTVKDGRASLLFDWSDSCLGEWSERDDAGDPIAGGEHRMTPLAEAVCVMLDDRPVVDAEIDLGRVEGAWTVVREGKAFGPTNLNRAKVEEALTSLAAMWPGELSLGRITPAGELREVIS